MKGFRIAFVIGLIGLGCALYASLPAKAVEGKSERQKALLDAGWRFHLGDMPGTETGISVAKWRWKADNRAVAGAQEMAAPDLNVDGSDWHDAATEDVFHGRRGFVWYRAALGTVPGPHRALHFENVDDNATVYLNGVKVGSHEGWGEPFDVNLDAAWKEGGPNLLAVLVQNTDGPGGIMGPVLLESLHEEVVPEMAKPNFSEKGWRAVDLPHDFVVDGDYDPKANGSHGFLPVGVGWYRKTFTLPASDRGERLYLDFDGVYRNSTVWLNGHKLGVHPSGYIGFRYDITPYASIGGKNVLAVRVDARHPEGWWYEGGGIYRHVWLVKTNPLHVAQWGTSVTAKIVGPEDAPNSAEVSLNTTVENHTDAEVKGMVLSQIATPNGVTVAVIASPMTIPAGKSVVVPQNISLSAPTLWSLETPNLYRLTTNVLKDRKTTDSVETPFGIRSFRFDAEKGFFLNGKSIKLKGTCNHQDFAGVGIALPDRLHVFKIEKLKALGSNAYRCSHNPPAPELLDACDRLGMLVMDENRHLGDTYSDHSPRGTPSDNLSDLRDMILRDRNHPSIIMWSMCNEEGLQGSPEGARIFRAMMDMVHRYDTSRPISCAMNGGWGNGISNVEDLQGCNYNPDGYDDFHRRFPNIPAYGSEVGSTVSTRGIYANDEAKGYVSAYDLNAPSWAQTCEVTWTALATRPFMAGGFVWTGFDYRGEPTPYAWPCINSHFGIIDTCGFLKDNGFYYKAWWSDAPVVHLFPHWNWPSKEGQEIDVWCHSNCDEVELILNGQSLGKKTMPRYGHLQWSVKYAPGKLEAKGYKDGKEIASDHVETTGAPAALQLTPDRAEILADSQDVSVVAVAIRDAQGRLVAGADNLVQFKISGDAKILGVGNGDPSSHEPDKATQRHAFNGYCMVLVQVGSKPGDIRLTAESPGLTPTTFTLQSIKAK